MWYAMLLDRAAHALSNDMPCSCAVLPGAAEWYNFAVSLSVIFEMIKKGDKKGETYRWHGSQK